MKTVILRPAIGLLTLLLICCSDIDNNAQESDEYLWLEELRGEKALNWAAEQTEQTLGSLASDSLFTMLQKEAEAILSTSERIPSARIEGGFAYNFWQDDDHVRGIWRRAPTSDYLDGSPQWETLLDLDEVATSEDEDWVWLDFKKHSDSDQCMIKLSRGGKQVAVWREFSIVAKRFVEGGFETPEAWTNLDWLDENSLFIATDWGPGTMGQIFPTIAKYWYRNGTQDSTATIIDASETKESIWPMVYTSKNGSFPFVGKSRAFHDITYYAVNENQKVEALPLPNDCDLLGMYEDQLLVKINVAWTYENSTYKAGSIVSLTYGTWKPSLLFYGEDRSFVEDAKIVNDRVYILVLEDVKGALKEAKYINREWQINDIDLPTKNGVLQITSSNASSNEILLTYNNPIKPDELYHYKPQTDPKLCYELTDQFDAENMLVEQRWVKSSDGVEVPYFVVARKSVLENGNAPTILYAYGGFGIPVKPRYKPLHGKLWIEKGGVYVIANIRGGGEFGPNWHQQALRTKRQQAFDDYYAVANDLISTGVTSNKKLGAWGASNGGLLTGAALTQRPELFGAVISEVPVLDLLRFKELGGANWSGEYGDPDDPSERDAIAKISPYHNCCEAEAYPEVLIVSAISDDTVHPAHARKMAAKLKSSGVDVLYFESSEGGHHGSWNFSGAAGEWALQYKFFHDNLFEGSDN